MKINFKKIAIVTVFITIGSILGYIYYAMWGCSGSCVISSNPYISAIYGGVIGILLSVVFSKNSTHPKNR